MVVVELSASPLRRIAALLLLLFLGWAALALWNSVKPMPPGTHVASLTSRVAESAVTFVCNCRGHPLLSQSLAAIDGAQQLILIDNATATPALTQHLLARKKRYPSIKIVLLTDQVGTIPGATPGPNWVTLEQAGVIVARIRATSLRDANPLYSSLWRLGLLRRSEAASSDRRALIIADDGSGGWDSLIFSGDPFESRELASKVGLQVHGQLAHDILNSELAIADWSSNDDRLPAAPSIEGGGVGSIDARFLTEGAIGYAALDALGAAGNGDEIGIAMYELGAPRLVDALLRAAAHGVRVRVLLDTHGKQNQATAAYLAGAMISGAGIPISVRWHPRPCERCFSNLLFVRHRADLWISLGSANFTRRSIDDFNLEANLELRLPARAAPAVDALGYFDQLWQNGLRLQDRRLPN